jgi:hypothetical protein
MIEYRINSSSLVSAKALLALGKEIYAKSGLVNAYEVVYTMFIDVSKQTVEAILKGEHKVYEHERGIWFFLDESEVNHE